MTPLKHVHSTQYYNELTKPQLWSSFAKSIVLKTPVVRKFHVLTTLVVRKFHVHHRTRPDHTPQPPTQHGRCRRGFGSGPSPASTALALIKRLLPSKTSVCAAVRVRETGKSNDPPP